MEAESNLTIVQVARICGCHRNTVLNYERRGYIESTRDFNNFRRYSVEQAQKLKEIFESRQPVSVKEQHV